MSVPKASLVNVCESFGDRHSARVWLSGSAMHVMKGRWNTRLLAFL